MSMQVGKSRGDESVLLTAILVGVTVLFLMLWTNSRLTKRVRPIYHLKRSSIFYIALATKVEELIREVHAEGNDITYMTFADMLLAIGRNADERYRRASISGLQCLFDIEKVSDNSRIVVKRNLEELLGKTVDSESQEPKVSAEDVLKYRAHVDAVFARQNPVESEV